MAGKLTRRAFLRSAVAGAGYLVLSAARRLLTPIRGGVAAEGSLLTPRVFLPVVLRNSPTSVPAVVHVHAADATNWDFASEWYGDAVDQERVDAMMALGLTTLTDTTSIPEAWAVLLPDYQPGEKIAVKVNLNNASCPDTDNVIDALIEPVNALIGSLVLAGVHEEDVWVYDAIRAMPARFYSRRQYTQARYFDSAGCADEVASFEYMDDSLRVAFTHPAMQTVRFLTDLLYQATYVINMPILKRHGTHPVTLGFKNHFGSLNNLGGGGDDNPHFYISPTNSRYDPDHSPLVDIYANSNIAGKTVLTVGDGLFGAPVVAGVPIPWSSFGDQAPNSLLFARDPVAIDCVMCDLLRAEWYVGDAAYDYLSLAEQRGLGVFERGEPWGAGYNLLDYIRVEA